MVRIFISFLLLIAPCIVSAYPVPTADVNGDGAIRVVFLVPSAGVPPDMQAVSDRFSEQMQKSSGKPVKSTVLSFSAKTLLMCGYSPDLKDVREQALAAGTDWVIACESPDIVRAYPEMAFEGLRKLKELASARGIRTGALLASKPSKTYRDETPFIIAPTLYRIADGLDLPVVPGAVAWWQCAKDNRLDGKENLRDASISYAYAASVAMFLLNGDSPETGTSETLREIERPLLRSVRTAHRRARSEPWHTSGKWNGVVARRMLRGPLKVAFPEGQFERMLASNLVAVAEANDVRCDIVAASEANFVFGRFNLLPKYLSENLVSASDAPQIAVFNRPVDTGDTTADEIRLMEDYVLKGYDVAKANGYIYVPFHLALARIHALRPELKIGSGLLPEPWVANLYATMLFSVCTSSGDILSPRPEEPGSLWDFGRTIGLRTLCELASLRIDLNTMRVRPAAKGSDSFAVFLDRAPAKKVKVHLDLSDADLGTLSEREFAFDRRNYNVPRTFSASRRKPGELRIVAASESDDPAADGLVETRIVP